MTPLWPKKCRADHAQGAAGARDPAITTKLLRVASSGYYNLGGNISLERALAYIGGRAIKEVLLTSLSLFLHQNGAMKKHL